MWFAECVCAWFVSKYVRGSLSMCVRGVCMCVVR